MKAAHTIMLLAFVGCQNESVAPVSAPEKIVTPVPAAQLPPLNQSKQILHDPRIALPKPAEIPPAEKEKVLGMLFPKYKKNREACASQTAGSKTMEEDIAGGNIAPVISSMAKGNFFSASEELTAYVVDVGECNANWTRFAPATTAMLILVKNNELKYKKIFEHYNHLKAVDLDQNGTHEILAIDEGASQEGYQNLSIYQFNGKEIIAIGDEYRSVFANVCNMPLNSKERPFKDKVQARVLSYATKERGKIPEIEEEQLLASCENPTEFVTTKGAQP